MRSKGGSAVIANALGTAQRAGQCNGVVAKVTYIRKGDARVVQRKSDRFPFAGDVLVVGKVEVPV